MQDSYNKIVSFLLFLVIGLHICTNVRIYIFLFIFFKFPNILTQKVTNIAKKCMKIWSCQKKAVPLHAFSHLPLNWGPRSKPKP